MTKKKQTEIEYKLRVYSVYKIITDTPLTKNELIDRLADMFASGNITAENEFWENTDVMCSVCGITLGHFDKDPDDSIPYPRCAQCQADYEKRNTRLTAE